jgi:hypothetical protein
MRLSLLSAMTAPQTSQAAAADGKFSPGVADTSTEIGKRV